MRPNTSAYFSNVISLNEKHFIFLLAAILYYLGVTSYTGDSEVWSVTVSQHAFDFSDQFSGVYQKPILGFILRLFYFFNLSSAEHLLAAKIVFTGIGVASFLLMLRFCYYELGKKWMYVYLILLLTSSVYISQYYRIRADVLTLFFTSVMLNVMQQATRRQWAIIPAGLCLFAIGTLMFLSTPKCIYSLAACAAYGYYALEFAEIRARGKIFLSLGVFLMPILFVAALGGVLFVSQEKVLLDIYGDSFRYFLRGYEFFRQFSLAKSFGLESGASDHFFVLRNLRFDFVHFSLIVLLIAVGLYKRWKKSLPKQSMALLLLGLISLASMFIHNQKLPFFWGSLMPLAILSITAVVKIMDVSWRMLSALLLLIFINATMHYSRGVWWVSGAVQLDAMNYLEKFLIEQKNPTFFDGIGILPRANYKLALMGPQDKEAADAALLILRNESPQVVLQLVRSQIVLIPFLDILKEKYTHIGHGVWILNEFHNAQTFTYPIHPWDVFQYEPGAVYLNSVSP